MIKILLIVCGPFRDQVIKEHGDFSALIAKALSVGGFDTDLVTFTIVNLFEDGAVLPADVTEFSAVFLSGSRYNVTETHPWIEKGAAWLRSLFTPAHDTRLPIFAICFGHQLICHALGGAVDWNPKGPEWGTFQVIPCENNREALLNDPLFRAAGLLQPFEVSAYHNQTVTKVPSTSVCLFRSELDDHQVLVHAPMVYSCQFHPEFTPALFRTYEPYLGFKTDELRQTFLRSLRETHQSMSMVASFLRLATQFRPRVLRSIPSKEALLTTAAEKRRSHDRLSSLVAVETD